MLVWEIVFGGLETLFMLFVIKVSKRIGNNYLARKFIHIGAGIIFLSIPYLYSSPIVPTTLSILFTIFTLAPRMRGRMYEWYQIKGNYGDLYFTLMATIIIPLTWYYDLWTGILALLLMGWGDAVTGFVRWKVYGGRVKGLWGTIAMIVFSVPTGYLIYGYSHIWSNGWIGALGGLTASLIEKTDVIDDNITVPLTSLATIIILKNLYP